MEPVPAWLARAVAAALALGTLALALAPDPIARRLAVPPGRDAAVQAVRAAPVVRALAVPLAASAAALAGAAGTPVSPARAAALAAASFLALGAPLRDWIVDDAAISFAYAENLASGHGLVLHPDHPREEGYSNGLWVLILALARALGLDIAVTAQLLGAALGALAVAAATHAAARAAPDAPTTVLAAATLATAAPVAIWCHSGLENALTASLTLVAALAPPAACAAALALLTLTRPEAPLLVAAVVAAELRPRGPRALALALPALLTWLAQLAFRLAYFGAPFPNPYYAKLASLNPLRLAVPGPGWAYVLDWLTATHLWAALPLLALAPPPRRLAALVAAQLAFAVLAGGDWMGAGRFFTATHLLLAVALAHARPPPRAALVVAAALALATPRMLVDFSYAPPTPMDRVAAVARAFQDVARALAIPHPRVAWHDSGGSSYVARLDVVDLGGLGNREIARHRADPAYLNAYLFHTARPAFFYSSDVAFAALWCGFHRPPEFARDYGPLALPAALAAEAPICAVRRDLVREAPGLRLERDPRGRLIRVVAD